MNCWNGLGVNYKSVDPAVIAQDIAYFKSIGLRYIRPHIPAYDASDLQAWRDVAKTFYDDGFFYVQWGISKSATLTSSNKATWLSAIDTEVEYVRTHNICHEFGLGNEEELHCDNSTLLYVDVRNAIRTKATEVNSILTIPISYQVECGTVGNGHGSDVWASEGKGNLDVISFNVYGSWNITTKKFNPQYKSFITNMYNAFGANCYISEFNLEANNTNLQDIPEERSYNEMRIMQKYIKDSGITRAELFQWRGHKSLNDDFAVKLVSGDYKLLWNALANNNGRQWFVNV